MIYTLSLGLCFCHVPCNGLYMFKSKNNWTQSQIERAKMLFDLYPTTEKTYNLVQGMSYIFENNTDKNVARLKLVHWYDKVQKS